MEEYQIAIFVTTFLIFLIFLGFLIWGIRSGQFVDVEAPKFGMLEGHLEDHDIYEDKDEVV